MEPTPQMERIAKGIRGLTIAVWCLVAVNVFQITAWVVPMFAPNFYMRHIAPSTPVAPRELFESWEGLSFEDKVKRSSTKPVLLITTLWVTSIFHCRSYQGKTLHTERVLWCSCRAHLQSTESRTRF